MHWLQKFGLRFGVDFYESWHCVREAERSDQDMTGLMPQALFTRCLPPRLSSGLCHPIRTFC